MVAIRLLTSIHGTDSPVVGDTGDILVVSEDVADVWADGERAELFELPTPLVPEELMTPAEPTPPVVLVDLVKHPPVVAQLPPADVVPGPTAAVQQQPQTAAKPGGRQRRTRPARA